MVGMTKAAGLKLLGWIHAVLGGAGLAVGGALCVVLWAGKPSPALPMVAGIFGTIAAGYFAPAFIGGVGLLRGAAWARWVIGALSLLILLMFPVGTALGGLGLWALLSADTPATNERAARRGRPAPSPKSRALRGPGSGSRLATCRHLRPVEAAMRASGLTVTTMPGRQATALCHIDAASLQARFRLPDFAPYVEALMGDPTAGAYPRAFLACNVCLSTIHVRHPDEVEPPAPWFPAPP